MPIGIDRVLGGREVYMSLAMRQPVAMSVNVTLHNSFGRRPFVSLLSVAAAAYARRVSMRRHRRRDGPDMSAILSSTVERSPPLQALVDSRYRCGDASIVVDPDDRWAREGLSHWTDIEQSNTTSPAR